MLSSATPVWVGVAVILAAVTLYYLLMMYCSVRFYSCYTAPLRAREDTCLHAKGSLTHRIHVFLYRQIGERMPHVLEKMEERAAFTFLPLLVIVWVISVCKCCPCGLKMSGEQRKLEREWEEKNKEWEELKKKNPNRCAVYIRRRHRGQVQQPWTGKTRCQHTGFTRHVHIFLRRHLREKYQYLLHDMESTPLCLCLPYYLQTALCLKIAPENLKWSENEKKHLREFKEQQREWDKKVDKWHKENSNCNSHAHHELLRGPASDSDSDPDSGPY